MREMTRQAKEQQVALERHINELETIVEERTRDLRETNKVIENPLRFFDGPEWANGEDCPADQAGGRLSAHRPRRRRDRHWQGARRSRDPPAECPTRAAICRCRLRRDPGHPDRVGTLRV